MGIPAALFFVGKYQLEACHKCAEVYGGSTPHVVPGLEQVSALGVQHHPLPVRKVATLKVIDGVENLVCLVTRKTMSGVCTMQIEQTLDALAQVATSSNVGLGRRAHGERFSPDATSL